MAEKTKINLAETEQSKLTKMYVKALTDLSNKTKKLIRKLQNLQEKEHYLVINQLTDAVIDFYGVDLQNIMKKNYDEWSNSDVSLHKIIKGNRAGEKAEGTAKKLEGNISTAIDEMFKGKPEKIGVDDSNPNIEPDKLNELENEINSYLTDVKETHKVHVANIIKEAEQNQLFRSIYGHVNATYEGAIGGFAARAGKVKGISAALLSAMKAQETKLSSLNAKISKDSKASGADTSSFPKVDFF